MVQLVGGSFLMGSSDPLAREADGEGPVREVVLSAFAMDHVAVSNDDFASFIEATGHRYRRRADRLVLVFAAFLPGELRRTAARSPDVPWWCAVASEEGRVI